MAEHSTPSDPPAPSAPDRTSGPLTPEPVDAAWPQAPPASTGPPLPTSSARPPTAATRTARLGPSPFRYHLLRIVLKVLTLAYVRVRIEGASNIPPGGPYILCFNHPSWLDPFVLTATWPDRERRLFIFGPREQDMSKGVRNRLIAWTGRGVPFKPRAQDVLDTTRRAVAVLHSGGCLAIAGEGRLSDQETDILPLQSGLAHFAALAGAPILPVAVMGTRWVHFGSKVRLNIGRPVSPGGFGRGRTGARAMTVAVEQELRLLLAGMTPTPRPGRFGAWFSELFNDRPWLDEATASSPSPTEPAPPPR